MRPQKNIIEFSTELIYEIRELSSSIVHEEVIIIIIILIVINYNFNFSQLVKYFHFKMVHNTLIVVLVLVVYIMLQY